MKIKNTRYLFRTIQLAFILSPLVVLSQDYLWPTNASNYLSSSFCEFRDGHYHSAIDIKTWNTEGYPCYAVEDGYIKRIRISPFGYGKVLYLQLEDGNTAVYAHLQKFTKAIEKQILEQQFNNKKYRLNWWPKNLKVKKGDIIAYTGRTGIGVPHLHFEIRNKQDRPVNPLRFYNIIKDHKKPKLQELLLIPLENGSSVNNNFLPQRFSIKHIKEGIYVVRDPIYVKGKVGFAVKGYDQADDVYNKYGFHQSTLESTGKTIFQITYDELDFSTTGHIYTEIFYPFWSDSREVFNKLYLESFNPLSFYNRNLGSDGSIIVKDKPVSYTITISDFMNNQSIIKGELLPVEENMIEIENFSMQDSTLYIKFKAPGIKDLKFLTKKNKKPWTPVSSYEIMEGKLNAPEESKLVRIHLDDPKIVSLTIRVNKMYEQKLSVAEVGDNDNFINEFTLLGEKLIGELSGSYKNLRLQEKDKLISVPSQYIQKENLQVLLTSDLVADKNRTLLIEDLNDKTWSSSLNYQALFPGERKKIAWFDSALVIETGINSVTDTILITAERHQQDSISYDIPIASDIFEIKPNNFPVFESISLSLQTGSLPEGVRWSLFKTNGKNRFRYLSSKLDSSKMTLYTKISSFGKFIVAADTVPPEIQIQNPKPGKIYKSTPKIKLFLKDTLSGIGSEDQITLSMDGEYVLPEWDPEEDFVIGILQNDLSSGNHVFSASIRDRSGNITRQAVYFKIQ